MKYLPSFLYLLAIFTFCSIAVNSEVIYTADLSFDNKGLIQGNVNIVLEVLTPMDEIVFFVYQNRFTKEKKESRIKTHYLYPDKLNTGKLEISDFSIDKKTMDIEFNISESYIRIPLDDNKQGRIEIRFFMRNFYPARIGPFGFTSNTLSSIYPPYPLLAYRDRKDDDKDPMEDFSIVNADHNITIRVPKQMQLLGKYDGFETKGISNSYRFAKKSIPYFSFSILPETSLKKSLITDETDFSLYSIEANNRALSNFFFLLTELHLFFTTNTRFLPSGNVILSPAIMENNMLLKGMDLVFYDPRLISMKPKFRSLVDFNIFRTLFLELIELSLYGKPENTIILSMINEFLSEEFYIFYYKELPQVPKSLFALSIITSVDLYDVYEKIQEKYGLSLNRASLDHSYDFYFSNLRNVINLYSFFKQIIGKSEIRKEIQMLLQKDPYNIDLEKEFYSQLKESGNIKIIEELSDRKVDEAKPESKEHSEINDLQIRGRGSLKRYSLGIESSPSLISSYFHDPEKPDILFYANSQLLLEPLEPALGYIYRFYITRMDLLKSTFGLSIEKDQNTLDGRFLYKCFLGRELTDKRSMFELQFFASYLLYKKIKTIEDETDKVYYTGISFRVTNRINDFMRGFSANITAKTALSDIFGIYDFQEISLNYNYVYYWTDTIFNKFQFMMNSLIGSKPSFIYNDYSTFNKAVSDSKSEVRKRNILGFGIEYGTALKKNLNSNLLDTFLLRRLEGSVFLELSFLGDRVSDFHDYYSTDIGFRITALTEFQNLLPLAIYLDIAFPLDSLGLEDIYVRISIREVF